MGMDILSDYRITALIVSERQLALHAERARFADERRLPPAKRPAKRPVERPVTSTGSLVGVPVSN
jgi:hypothetical protein